VHQDCLLGQLSQIQLCIIEKTYLTILKANLLYNKDNIIRT
jgi:hypothetical protein